MVPCVACGSRLGETPLTDDDDDDDDSPGATADRTCVDCGAVAPRTRTAHTLIGGAHGWRLRKAQEGKLVRFEWRCRTCWAAFKARTPDSRR